MFSFPVGELTINVYAGKGLTAAIVRGGREYPVETRLELDYEGRPTDASKALFVRVLKDDLKLEPEAVNAVETTFYRKEFMEKIKEKSASITLRHINDIEDPTLTNKLVEVGGLIVSNSVAMLVPTKVVATGLAGKDEVNEELNFYAGATSLPLELAGLGDDRKAGALRRNFPRLRGTEFVEKEYRTLYRLLVRAQVFTLEKDPSGKVIDDQGREYKSHELFVISDKAADFPPSTLIKVKGWVLPSPRTGRPVVLADRWEFPEKAEAYDVKKLKQLKAKFDAFQTVDEKADWILNEFEKYSHIIKRQNVALCNLLVFFTPTWVRFDGEVQRGWGLGAVVGDTTTAKSETTRKLIMLLQAGTYLTAETASQVGLMGAAVQVEGVGWFVDWGFLVSEDRRLLALDGCQKLSAANWAALAEAERLGVVSIAKAAKAQAPARTRQIKIANAIDEERNKYSTKAMKTFLHTAQALATILDKTSIARQDLAVFVSSDDVKAEEVNVEGGGAFDPDLTLLSEVLKWTWSGKAPIAFTSEAVVEILHQATRLYEKFHVEEIPLVSIDAKWKLARLSAALASMTLSTNDFTTIEVRKEHVDYITQFLEEEYTNVGLHTLAAEERHEVLSKEEATSLISAIAFDTFAEKEETGRGGWEKVLRDKEDSEARIREIVKFIAKQGRVTRDQVKTQFSLNRDSELKPLFAKLETEGLVKRGNGFYSTSKGIRLIKLLSVPPAVRSVICEGSEKEGVLS